MPYQKHSIEVRNGQNHLSIDNLPFGVYAIAVYHDQNSNGKLDANFFGIPKEQTGASNNPDRGGMPTFRDAKFKFDGSLEVLTIRLK